MPLESQKQTELLELIDRLCHEAIQEDEMERLNALLLDDAEAQAFYLQQVDLINSLRWQGASYATYESVVVMRSVAERDSRPAATKLAKTSVSTRKWWAGVCAVAAAGICVVAVFVLVRGGQVNAGPVLTHTSGHVLVVRKDGRASVAESGERIEEATIRTVGTSLAVVAYDDGPQFTLAGGSIVAFTNRNHREHVSVEQGTVAASIERRQPRQSLVVETPLVLIEEEVSGTEFSLSATRQRTDVKVSEGKVKVTRSSDGESIVVPRGKRVATDSSSALVYTDIGPPPDTWSEDFEIGLPSGWQQGEFVGDDLPSGSGGAVATAFVSGSQPPIYAITSQHVWMDGLFVIHPDSHLNMTLKMERARWINIFFITRTDDPKNPTTFLHNFASIPLARVEPGVWQTVRIPLSKFRRRPVPAEGFTDTPKLGELVFGMSFSAPEPDRKVVIDRVWVSRGGPDKVTLEPLE